MARCMRCERKYDPGRCVLCASEDAFREGYESGVAACVFACQGLVGMGLAIKANAPRVIERSYWTSEIDGTRYYDCACPGEGCGVRMKRCKAGEDEGTDNEYCGLCRY